MKKLIILIIISLILCPIAIADQVTLAWDPNDPVPDGYKLFQRTENNNYDYLVPITNDTYQDGIIPGNITAFTTNDLNISDLVSPNSAVLIELIWNKTENIITLEWNQPITTIDLTYYFVVRAFVGEDESGDSNEVSYIENNTISVNYWNVYYSEISGGPWTILSTVQNTGQVNPIITDPLTIVQSGEIKTVYFTVVSFVNETLYSQNAQEMAVTIDRRVATPPTNLTIVTTIPVE